MNKIAVIGDKDSVLGFNTLGIDVYFTDNPTDTSRLINECAKNGYAVLFITEQAAKDAKPAIDRYKTMTFPAITLIPNNKGNSGLGLASIKENMEKAIGADIFSGERG